MRILLSISVLSLAFLSGCATTEKLAQKVHLSSSDTPLGQVLKEKSDLVRNLSTVEFRQYFNNVEAPTVADVKVTETGLMDDSVSAIRTTYSFKLKNKRWEQVSKKEEYRCARGQNTKDFQTALCL